MRYFFTKEQIQTGEGKGGFTLLFAVLVGSLLFTIGAAVANIALGELKLASFGKWSETAFSAADVGLECALYYDFVVQKTLTSSGMVVFPKNSSERSNNMPNPSVISCAGHNTALTQASVTGFTTNQAITTFYIQYPIAAPNACAKVTVTKVVSPATVVIESRGRNDADCNSSTSNPNRVERALRATY